MSSLTRTSPCSTRCPFSTRTSTTFDDGDSVMVLRLLDLMSPTATTESVIAPFVTVVTDTVGFDDCSAL